MYNTYFGFSESPFNITPNSRFYYRTKSCDEILATVQHGIQSRKGVIVVTGEPGTGKTLLLKFLQRELSPKVKTVTLQNPHTDFDGLLQLLLNRLEQHDGAGDRTAKLETLAGYLIEQRGQGRMVCLLIDEAQDLDASTLDELRLLANLEFEADALLAIVLIGQPELNLKLDHPSATRIKQRVALTFNTYPLVRMEIGPYIQARLEVAGYEKTGLFDPQAIDAIAAYSGGIPRIVNSICDNSLMRAFKTNASVISPAMIDQVARDLRIAVSASLQRPFPRVEFSNASSPMPHQATNSAAQAPAAAAGEQTVKLVEVPVPKTIARPQESHPEVLSQSRTQDIRETGHVDRESLSPKSNSDRRKSDHELADARAQAGSVPGGLLPTQLRWYAVTAVLGLSLLLLKIVNSSQFPGLYSVASSARPTVSDGGTYRASNGEKAHKVELIRASVSQPPSNPISWAPERLETAASQPGANVKRAPQNAARNVNGKKPAPLKASAPPLPPDEEPWRDEATNLAAKKVNRSAEAGKTIKVVAVSLLRKKPSAGAEIISSLEPGSRITVLAKSGDFYHVRSVDKNPIRGYVHREDAFFERRK